MKRINLLLMVLALVVLALSAYSFSQTYFVVEQSKVNVSVEVGNVTGIDLGNRSLDFGTMVSNTSAKKNINLTNSYSSPLLVNLSTSGNASEFIYHEPHLEVDPSSTREVAVVSKIPKGAERGNYSGTFMATMKKKPF